jgi:3-oxoacyl-[acyl-carrier-protein] synthase-1
MNASGGQELAISAVGMVTSLGLDAFTSCAEARAGVVRSAFLRTINAAAEDLFGGEPVLGHALPCSIGEGFVGVAKATVLGEFALRDLISRRQLSPAELARTGCYFVLSDYLLADAYERSRLEEGEEPDQWTASALWKRECTGIAGRVLGRFRQAIPPANQKLVFAGHTGVAIALINAANDIRTGRIDRCLIGAVDSCVEPRALRTAAWMNMLKIAPMPFGYIPGEAGAFLLLERAAEIPAASGAPVRVCGADVANEGQTRLEEKPPLGVGLSQALANCMRQAGDEVISGTGSIVSDLNGDPYRANEWGYCLVRLRSSGVLEPMRLMVPASSFGETGCAAGAVGICVAVRSLQRRYGSGRGVLVALSGDDGTKAAVSLYA